MSSSPGYPVRFSGGDDLRRSRLTVLFRLVLLIPHLLLLMLYGLAAFFAAVAAWFARSSRAGCPRGCTTS
jgi:hypothetical protein